MGSWKPIISTLDSDAIVADYGSGMAIADIASKHGLSDHHIRKVFRRAGVVVIDRRVRSDYVPHNKAEIAESELVRLHGDGHGWSAIARLMNLPMHIVRSRGRMLGLNTNKPKYEKCSNIESQIGKDAYKRLSDRSWLYRAYIIENGTTRDIAKKLGCGKKAVLSALKRHNIPVGRIGVNRTGNSKRKNFERQVPKEVIGKIDTKEWMYEQYITLNRSARSLSEELLVSEHCVVSWIKRHGLYKTKKAKLDAILAGYVKRMVSMPCGGHYRGVRTILETSRGGIIRCDSNWEKIVAEFLDCHPLVYTFAKESIRISYHFDGPRVYLPDFVVHLAKRNLIIEVKPQIFLSKSKNVAKLVALEEYAYQNNYDWLVLTGKSKIDLRPLMDYLDDVKRT